MKLFNIFKKKKKDPPVPELKEKIEKTPVVEGIICESCEKLINSWEKSKTFDKKKYHIKCFRKTKKIAKAQYGRI
jgi:hypothetical protein